MSKEKIWNLPNMLTMLRIALIFVFIWVFLSGWYTWALVVFLTASATDFLDGHIARKRQLVTNFGKLMDPLADKLMLLTALICLTAIGRVPVWMVLVVLAKELLMVLGAFWVLRHGVVVQARFLGKAATVAFMVAVAAAFLQEYIAPWDYVLLCVAVALSLAAMVFYIVDTARTFRGKA